MNLSFKPRSRHQGYALIVTLCLILTMLIVFGGMISWTASVARITQRNNQYVMSQAAAEGMVEVVMGTEMRDYEYQSLHSNLNDYTSLAVPPSLQTDSNLWPVQYWFTDANGNSNSATVNCGLQQAVLQPEGSQFPNLMGYPWFWTNIVTATPIGQPYTVPVTVTQIVNFSSIPVFQYAIFYNLNLEIDPGSTMNVNGPVFSNAGIWAGSGNLTFNNTVSAAGTASIATADPFCCSKTDVGTPQSHFPSGQPTSGNTALVLPIAGSSGDPTVVESILNIPPAATYGMGTAAAYTTNGEVYMANACDLIISNAAWGISTNPLTLTVAHPCTNNISIWYQDQTGTQPNYLTPVTPNYYVFAATNYPATGRITNWISGSTADTNRCYTNVVYAGWSFVTNALFYDYRESAYVQAVSLNVTNLSLWFGVTNANANGGSVYTNYCQQAKGHSIDAVWIYNAVPPVRNATLPGVRVSNGIQLPTKYGLTVATPMPIYVWGDYNKQVNSTNVSSGTNTANTYPSALMGDAITLLSINWQDSYNSGTALSSRTLPVATTLNAACLEGIVQSSTNTCNYSGGTENFLRFLENWAGVQTTYNGSIVVMFPSIYATNAWNGNYYGVPARNWGFDYQFTHQNCLPPMTPCMKKTVRISWAAN